MISSLLSARPMARKAVGCSLVLVAQVIIVVIYASSVFMLPSQPNQSAFGTLSGPNEQIVFFSNRDGNQEILYVVNAADGSDQTRLTYNDVQDTGSSWSPDGTKIAFANLKDGNPEIYVMNSADGSEQTRLTINNATDAEPDW
jgi:Tol biopolymer transport system component